jgi:DNA-binding NarL/FixJ family response regulator
MTENQRQIRELLEQGIPAARIGAQIGVSNRTVYQYIRKNRLPRNMIPQERGRREQGILAAKGAGFSHEEVGELFSLAPAAVEFVVNRAYRRMRGEAE